MDTKNSFVNQKSSLYTKYRITEYYFDKEPSLFIERVLGMKF